MKVGDEVEVYVDRVENSAGEAMLSRDRARREAAWDKLEKEFEAGNRVEGVIFGRVKGGFTVDLGGAVAFLPGAQVDIRPVRDVGPLMDIPQPFQIFKMDRRRGNIVVSRRAILEETRAEQRSGLIQSLAEGQVIEGVVKNITDYGAFVDLGGIDGLLHVTDISYKRVNHPSEVLGIGDTVKVQIIRINQETQRISLGMKQLESDPWEGAAAKYPVGGAFRGRVTNITEYGAFVELEPGIEGLVHVSEMSWTKKNVHPGKIVSTSQEVDVKVLEVDEEKRRISLGLKQAQANPWAAFAASPSGRLDRRGRSQECDRVRAVRRARGRRRRHGPYVGHRLGRVGRGSAGAPPQGRDGHRPGARRRCREGAHFARHEAASGRRRRSRRSARPGRGRAARAGAGGVNKGDTLTVTVRDVRDGGLDVQVGDDGATGFVKRTDLGRDRDEQRPERFQVGQKFDAQVIGFDRSKKPNFSIKALQIAEEKQAVAQYGSSDSGASLGDILGAALKEKAEASAKEAEAGGQGREGSAKADKASGQGRKGGKSRQAGESRRRSRPRRSNGKERRFLAGRRSNPACVGETFLTA